MYLAGGPAKGAAKIDKKIYIAVLFAIFAQNFIISASAGRANSIPADMKGNY